MPALPATLPQSTAFTWQTPLASIGLGGLAATEQFVIVSDRELNDTLDCWKCHDAADGSLRWAVRVPAPGLLDYGNSPRATPVIASGRVFLFGAFGHLLCVNLADGETVWETNLRDEFEPDDEPKWGACSTPLLLGKKLIVNPGAKDASLAALDVDTGKLLWKTPGKAAGYGSLIAASVHGRKQIIGHDAISLGGWDPETGERLWALVPEKPNDFNVPTPMLWNGRLVVSTENNGTRLLAFDDSGRIVPKPLAVHRKLAPDTHTPVVCGNRLFGVWRRLYCLDLSRNLRELWSADDTAFNKYCTIVADDHRVMVISMAGELILFDAAADDFDPIARLKPFAGDAGMYSHPAFVGRRIYMRSGNALVALDLG